MLAFSAPRPCSRLGHTSRQPACTDATGSRPAQQTTALLGNLGQQAPGWEDGRPPLLPWGCSVKGKPQQGRASARPTTIPPGHSPLFRSSQLLPPSLLTITPPTCNANGDECLPVHQRAGQKQEESPRTPAALDDLDASHNLPARCAAGRRPARMIRLGGWARPSLQHGSASGSGRSSSSTINQHESCAGAAAWRVAGPHLWITPPSTTPKLRTEAPPGKVGRAVPRLGNHSLDQQGAALISMRGSHRGGQHLDTEGVRLVRRGREGPAVPARQAAEPICPQPAVPAVSRGQDIRRLRAHSQQLRLLASRARHGRAGGERAGARVARPDLAAAEDGRAGAAAAVLYL